MQKTETIMRSFLFVAASVLAFSAVACAEAPEDGNPALPAATPDCALTPYATGCSAPSKKADSDKDTSTTPSTPDVKEAADTTCAAKTCEDFGGACGEHDDGCGKKFSCGECKPKDCKKKTCDDLNQQCGTHDDGCGSTVNCGQCATACATDSKEPNNTQGQATDLGKFADTEDKTVVLKNLASSDGDEDWFKMAVTDEGFGSNPTISITSTDAKMEVSVFHECKSLPNYSYCNSEGHQDNAVGFGCTNMGTTVLKTDCKGTNEAGTTYVRVRKAVSDTTCHSYDLSVYVY